MSGKPAAPALSLIVPTYNERENLPLLVARVAQALAGSWEMVVVDDASPDGTGQVARGLAQGYPLRLVQRQGKLGLASAVLTGFEAATGEVLGVMDADLQHPPEVLPALLAEMQRGAELVVASRYVPGGGMRNWDWRRRLVSLAARELAHLFIPRSRPIQDPLSGCFLLRREVIQGVPLSPLGFKILLEVIVRGRYCRIAEVPYTFEGRRLGRSNLVVREYWYYLKHLWRLRHSGRVSQR